MPPEQFASKYSKCYMKTTWMCYMSACEAVNNVWGQVSLSYLIKG